MTRCSGLDAESDEGLGVKVSKVLKFESMSNGTSKGRGAGAY